MLERLRAQPRDEILALMGMHAADPRPGKIDLGVGVYRNPDGITPVFRAVKEAEHRLWEREDTKTYTGLAGDAGFREAMRALVLGDSVGRERVAAAATTGGTGAVRHAFEMVRAEAPGAAVWHSSPTWPSHLSILRHLGARARPYRYYDHEARAADFGAMMADLEGVAAGDVVLLHGCCHNPTGADLGPGEWRAVADLCARAGAVPMIDVAYQGFGDGLAEDAAGLRLVAGACPETLVAASCSKNFGLYRERAGVLLAVAPDARAAGAAQAYMEHLNRQSCSFPPDHGARLATMVLEDGALRASWEEELEGMRVGMRALRAQLSDELRRLTGSDRFGFFAGQRGMFSLLGATPDQVDRLREDHAVYMVGDGRMNVAGLNAGTVPVLAAAIAEALG